MEAEIRRHLPCMQVISLINLPCGSVLALTYCCFESLLSRFLDTMDFGIVYEQWYYGHLIRSW